MVFITMVSDGRDEPTEGDTETTVQTLQVFCNRLPHAFEYESIPTTFYLAGRYWLVLHRLFVNRSIRFAYQSSLPLPFYEQPLVTYREGLSGRHEPRLERAVQQLRQMSMDTVHPAAAEFCTRLENMVDAPIMFTICQRRADTQPNFACFLLKYTPMIRRAMFENDLELEDIKRPENVAFTPPLEEEPGYEQQLLDHPLLEEALRRLKEEVAELRRRHALQDEQAQMLVTAPVLIDQMFENDLELEDIKRPENVAFTPPLEEEPGYEQQLLDHPLLEEALRRLKEEVAELRRRHALQDEQAQMLVTAPVLINQMFENDLELEDIKRPENVAFTPPLEEEPGYEQQLLDHPLLEEALRRLKEEVAELRRRHALQDEQAQMLVTAPVLIDQMFENDLELEDIKRPENVAFTSPLEEEPGYEQQLLDHPLLEEALRRLKEEVAKLRRRHALQDEQAQMLAMAPVLIDQMFENDLELEDIKRPENVAFTPPLEEEPGYEQQLLDHPLLEEALRRLKEEVAKLRRRHALQDEQAQMLATAPVLIDQEQE